MIVFNLESNILGRVPIVIPEKITTEIYQQVEFKLDLKSFWTESGVFNIKIISKDEQDMINEANEEKRRIGCQ